MMEIEESSLTTVNKLGHRLQLPLSIILFPASLFVNTWWTSTNVMASRPRRSVQSKYRTKSPKTPKGMVNGLKSEPIESETATEIENICADSFKIPKELDINVSHCTSVYEC